MEELRKEIMQQVNEIKKEVEGDMKLIKAQYAELSAELKIVKNALIGNEYSKDGGLVGRIYHVETDHEILTKRVQDIEDERLKGTVQEKKTDFYIKILWGLASSLVTLIITYFAMKLVK